MLVKNTIAINTNNFNTENGCFMYGKVLQHFQTSFLMEAPLNWLDLFTSLAVLLMEFYKFF